MSQFIIKIFTSSARTAYIVGKNGGVMDYIYASELPYPDIAVEENLADSKMLMPAYGGPAGEITAVMTYSFQDFISVRNEDLRKILEGVALTEMVHMELLGTTIYKLGGYPVMGGRTYWNGSFANYTLEPKKFLQQNIMAEESAILNYERTILNVSQESIKLLLERIILDEEIHIKIFKELLNAF